MSLATELRDLLADEYYREPIFHSYETRNGVKHPLQDWQALTYARGLLREISLMLEGQ
jgi:hypothetical protein